MADRTYIDFDLTFRRQAAGPGYLIEADCEGAQNRADLEVPFDDDERRDIFATLEASLAAIRARDVGAPGPPLPTSAQDFKEKMQTYGERLYDALFVDDVGKSFHVLRDRVSQDSSKGIRIRLRFDDTPELADLPWEYLYYKKDTFLSLRDATPIVRHLNQGDLPPGPQVTPPLSMLVIVSKGVPPLDVDREIGLIRKALAKLEEKKLFKVVTVAANTVALSAALSAHNQHQIVHFMGHSGFEAANGAKKAILQLDDGAIDASFLITRLDPQALRLVVLNSCDGARTAADDAFTALAHGFVKQGVMAVVAMQLKISDEAAIAFSEGFYGGLADGWSIEASVARGRSAILGPRSNPTEWGTPVLFTRGKRSVLFSFDLSSEQRAQQDRIDNLSRQVRFALEQKQWDIAITRLQQLIAVRDAMFNPA